MQINAAARLRASYTFDLSEALPQVLTAVLSHFGFHAQVKDHNFYGITVPSAVVSAKLADVHAKFIQGLTKAHAEVLLGTMQAVTGEGLHEEAHTRIYDQLTLISVPGGDKTMVLILPYHKFIKIKSQL